MPELAKESVALFSYLLPGFLAAWVLYGLTSDPKPSQFERVIQALILTFAVHVTVPLVEGALTFMGERTIALRPWDDVASNLAKVTVALILGLLLTIYTNTDAVHKWFRGKGITTRTSYPSEWFGVFSTVVTYVVLHLNDGRRLYGWPKEWPNEADRGHFYIMQACWISDDGTQTDLPDVHGILIPSKEVRWVEFVGKPIGDENGT